MHHTKHQHNINPAPSQDTNQALTKCYRFMCKVVMSLRMEEVLAISILSNLSLQAIGSLIMCLSKPTILQASPHPLLPYSHWYHFLIMLQCKQGHDDETCFVYHEPYVETSCEFLILIKEPGLNSSSSTSCDLVCCKY